VNPAVDSGPKLPRQIVAQADHARELLKAGQEAQIPETPVATAETPPAAPPSPAFTLEQLLNAPDATKDASRDYWYARAQAVEGFRREDNARNARKVKDLEKQIAELTVKNTELVQSHPAAQPVINLADHFTEDEIESFGADRATAIVRNILKTGASNEAAIKELRAQVTKLLARQTEEVEETEIERNRKFVAGLDAGFPTWQATDQDPRWRKWLAETDENTGLIRQEIVNRHKANNNADGIVKLLNQWVQSLGPAKVPDAPPITPSSMDGTGGDAPPKPNPGAGDGKILTADEIKKGYKDIATRKMSPEDERLFHARVAAQMLNAGRG
jgi:hypothetical protein